MKEKSRKEKLFSKLRWLLKKENEGNKSYYWKKFGHSHESRIEKLLKKINGGHNDPEVLSYQEKHRKERGY